MPETPDEKLTAIIIEKLRTQGLIPEHKLAELQANMAKGAVRTEDWRNFIELALPRENNTQQEGQDE